MILIVLLYCFEIIRRWLCLKTVVTIVGTGLPQNVHILKGWWSFQHGIYTRGVAEEIKCNFELCNHTNCFVCSLTLSLFFGDLVCRLPTLIIAECVLIYLDPNVSRAVVKWCADKLETAAFVIYEQVTSSEQIDCQITMKLMLYFNI